MVNEDYRLVPSLKAIITLFIRMKQSVNVSDSMQ
jgi:hypothetical protein